MGRRKNEAGCETDMTPMIDVVFQLIIFFIVTIKMDKDINKDIQLEFAKDGPVIKEQDPRTVVVEIDKRGWISMHNAKLRPSQLRGLLRNKYKKYGEYPVLIRADLRTRHKDVKTVMDICTECGLWRINFAAIQDKKT